MISSNSFIYLLNKKKYENNNKQYLVVEFFTSNVVNKAPIVLFELL
ncbi:hypothetical protein FLAVO9R_50075 [Flavobacterium sp. 9R]|nr:hypothetical protein FLAVO9R_50075 [Flavobacterium sp. 9R]